MKLLLTCPLCSSPVSLAQLRGGHHIADDASASAPRRCHGSPAVAFALASRPARELDANAALRAAAGAS